MHEKGMNKKKFSGDDYNENDPQSKQEAVDFLSQISKRISLRTPLTEQQEAYKKRDFTVYHDDTPITVEVERKLVWVSSDGSFKIHFWRRNEDVVCDTVDVPARKDESRANWYVMFNHDFSALAFTEMKNVLSSPVIQKDTRQKRVSDTKNEDFFRVPISLFTIYTKNDGAWQRA
jgi:hypothetical protein